MKKTIIIVSATIFGILGGYVPYLWGDKDLLSVSSILIGTVGALFGIWVGLWINKQIG